MASRADVDKLVSAIQVLKNRDLVFICQQNHLTKSGNKADLQKRIVNLIDSAFHDPNPQKFQNIKSSILSFSSGNGSPGSYRVGYISSPLPSSPYNDNASPSPYSGHTNSSTNGTHPSSYASFNDMGHRPSNHARQGLQFKPSPFYEIDTQVGDIKACEAMTQHRNSIPIPIRATTYPDLQRCLNDSTLKVMIFCASANTGVQDIAFPYQCEIKINGGDVKANLRGLKNKPGSTRPVDITSYLRLKPPSYNNTLDFTYALTAKPFYLALYICRTFSATVLAERIEKRGRITKASVVREVTRQAQDPDIVATSQVLSLKCPLTYMRLTVPIRAVTCKHIQCFDATSYLQLQQQGPQWICPVCSNPAPFESLAVDEYVKDILANTPSEQDQATIEPDGSWHMEKPQTGAALSTPTKNQSQHSNHSHSHHVEASYIDDDLDLKILTPLSSSSRNGGAHLSGSGGTTSSSTLPHGTPYSSSGLANGGNSNHSSSADIVVSSRDTTATPSGGQKRSREVIDLTLSDSEDEADGQPPLKRQHVSPHQFSSA